MEGVEGERMRRGLRIVPQQLSDLTEKHAPTRVRDELLPHTDTELLVTRRRVESVREYE